MSILKKKFFVRLHVVYNSGAFDTEAVVFVCSKTEKRIKIFQHTMHFFLVQTVGINKINCSSG
jgi:hypothetical protein